MTSKKVLSFLFLFIATYSAVAQSAIVTNISLSGNEKTKDYVILREVLLEKDSAYFICSRGDFFPLVQQSENRILNLNLFNQVTVTATRDSMRDGLSYYSMAITVVEKWYIWPMPFVEFSDRNFNVWGDLDFDPERTNYGLYVFNYNLFGRNHTLKTKLKTGYNTEAGIEYRIPFLSKNTQWGLKTMVAYNSQNEVWYTTENDSLQFFKNGNSNLIKTTKAHVEFSKRIRPNVKMFIGGKFMHSRLSDSVPKADFFVNDDDFQRDMEVYFQYEVDSRDNIYYPLTGTFYKPKLSLLSSQNSENQYYPRIALNAQWFNQLADKWYSAFSVFSQYTFNNNLAYSNRQLLGYSETIRGFEHYVMDGKAGWRGSIALRHHLLDKSRMKLNFVPIKNYKVLPLNVYVEAYVDGGYVSYDSPHHSNGLINTLLYSGGIGINTLFYNDRLLRLEYSLNSLKEGGFFVHFKKAI